MSRIQACSIAFIGDPFRSSRPPDYWYFDVNGAQCVRPGYELVVTRGPLHRHSCLLLKNDPDRNERWQRGYNADWPVPLKLVREWEHLVYPREASLMAVDQWRKWLAEYRAAWTDASGAECGREIDEKTERDLARLREAWPELFESGAALSGQQATERLDGPVEGNGYRLDGITVRFGKSRIKHRLLTYLWDAERGRPHEYREIEDVIKDVWNDEQTSDKAVTKMCQRVSDDLRGAGILWTVQCMTGRVWLAKCR
jgi:hypothetical protein